MYNYYHFGHKQSEKFNEGFDATALSKDFLGGKGYGLASMSTHNVPVPPGFVIPTSMCLEYLKAPKTTMMKIGKNIELHLSALKEEFGYNPLLSVRSGAPISMPGMMETILNVGLIPDTLEEWADRLGIRPTLDSYRRFVQMYGEVVAGISSEYFENAISEIKSKYDVESDQDLPDEALAELCDEDYLHIYATCGEVVPKTVKEQVLGCIEAVFRSWNGDKAKTYRAIHSIPDDMGTAVVVQTMVFGNLNDNSGSGVMFTRCPSTGANKIVAEYLSNAQGEDVVAGIRTPESLVLDKTEQGDGSSWQSSLIEVATYLEATYQDMQDIEFTVQDGELFILQTRAGKRTAKSAVVIAQDLISEGVQTLDQALGAISVGQYRALMRPRIDDESAPEPFAVGLPASTGVVSGVVVLTSEDAVKVGSKAILVREETTPNDIAGMHAASGILTSTGGVTSHAAVVARAMDKTCVVGASTLVIDAEGIDVCDPAGNILDHIPTGSVISIDGETGRVFKGPVPVIGGEDAPEVNWVRKSIVESVKDNTTLISDYPRGNHILPLHNAFVRFGVETTVGMVSETLDKDNSANIILDISSPIDLLDDNDTTVLHVVGDTVSSKLFTDYENNLKKFMKGINFYKNRVKILPYGAAYHSNINIWDGYVIVTNPDKMGCLLESSTCMPSEEFILNIVGSYSAWDKIVEKLGLKVEGKPMFFEQAVVSCLKG